MNNIKFSKNLYEGETLLPRVKNKSKVADSGNLFIDHVYARGGLIILHYVDYKKNIEDTKYLTPEEAKDRLFNIMTMPKTQVRTGLVPAIIKAYEAALHQSENRNNAILATKEVEIEQMTREAEEALLAARIADPELHEEMCKIEREANVPEFILPKRSKKDDLLPDEEIISPDHEAVAESVPNSGS